MPVVRAGPNQYLLVGRGGDLENRGSAVQTWLRPGTIYVLVPGTKQEAFFEFTQETKDGIPLRFKGTFVYRITEPVAAARLFDFSDGNGLTQITTLLTHVCFGELRDAVSHMSMVECIEERKTTLTGVVAAALQRTIHDADDPARSWGVQVEAAQVAQVFIVDAQLRQQLEAEVRNEIKVKSDRSNMQAQEDLTLAELASVGRVQEQKLASDQEDVRRQEALELAQVARERRRKAEDLATERHLLELEQARLHSQLDADQDRVLAEAPVRLLQIEHERAILQEELALRELQNQVKALEVERDLLLSRAQQDLRREIIGLEQAPRIVEAASKVLHGTSLSIYGENAVLLGQLAPIFDVLTRAVTQSTEAAFAAGVEPVPEAAPVA